MTTLKVLINFFSALFFGLSAIFLFTQKDYFFHAILATVLSLFFFLMALITPKLEKIIKDFNTLQNLKNYYLSLIPDSWPEVKKKLYLKKLKDRGVNVTLESFKKLSTEEMKSVLVTNPRVSGATELIESIEALDVFEAKGQLGTNEGE